MDLTFISSPYRGDLKRNLKYALDACLDSFSRGEAPFAPHLLYPQILDDTDPTQRARGMQAGAEWLDAADTVAFYIDYGWTAGMFSELKLARVLGKKNIQQRTLLPNVCTQALSISRIQSLLNSKEST